MHRFLLVITFLLGFTAPAATQEPPKVTTLFSRDLSDIPGKEGGAGPLELLPANVVLSQSFSTAGKGLVPYLLGWLVREQIQVVGVMLAAERRLT
jgi:hypothetical protein